jgi:hypothetical protein
MTDFQKALEIRGIFLMAAGESCAEGLGNETLSQRIAFFVKCFEKRHNISLRVNPNMLTVSEMTQLGFAPYYRNTRLYLIPIWLFNYIVDEGFELVSITDSIHHTKKSLDGESRFGLSAFGVLV